MKIETGGRVDKGDTPCDNVQDDAWGARDYVQFCVHANILWSLIACVHVLLGKVTISLMECLQWDAHNLKNQIIGALSRLWHCFTGPYSRRERLSDGRLRDLIVDAGEPCSFAKPYFWLFVAIWPGVSTILFKRLRPTLSDYDARCSQCLITLASQ